MKQKIINVFLAFLTTLSLAFNIKVPTTNYLDNFYNINILTFLITFFGLYTFYQYAFRKFKKSYGLLFLAFIIAAFQVMGAYFGFYDSLHNAISTPFQMLKTLVVLFGLSILFYVGIQYLFSLFDKIRYKAPKNKYIDFIFNEHPFWCTMGILLLCYIPIMIILYPGSAGADMYDEILQCFHVRTSTVNTVNLLDENVYINGHHSPFHSMLSAILWKVGYSLGNVNLGLFFNVLFQVALALYVFGYTFKLCKELKVPIFYRISMLFLYAFTPFFNVYVVSCVKDLPFSLFVLLYTCHLIEFIYLEKRDKATLIKMGLSSLLVGIICKKGFYVVFITIPVLMFMYRKIGYKILTCLVLPLLLLIGWEKIALPVMHITPGSIREPLSVPISQVARYVKNHGEELTKEEIEAISNVLDYDSIPQNFNPKLSDPVKNTWNKNYSKEDLKKFLTVYVKLFFKHPTTYVSQFLNGTYGYYWLDYTINPGYYELPDKYAVSWQVKFTRPSYAKTASSFLQKIYAATSKMPVIQILDSLAFYVWILILLIVYMFMKKDKTNVLILLPAFVVLLLLLVSPDSNNSRYVLPIVYSVPMLIAFGTLRKVNNNSKKVL